MELTREYILRLQKNRQGTAVGGSGTAGISGNYVTPAQLESALANKVDVSFFSRLFELYNGEGTTAAKIETNATLPEDTSKLNIKAPFDFWSQRSVSALGKGDSGSSSVFDEAAMWTALGGSIDNKQIALSHLTTALNGYVKGVKVGETIYNPNASGIVDLGTITGRTYAFDTGKTNGTFKVTPSVGDAYEVPIKGLAALAYKASLTAEDIPNIDATKITTGILGVDRIPGLSADKITSGTLSVDRIPDLSGKYVTTTFFNKLFRAQDASGSDITVNAGTAVDSIKAMVGFWTNQYISALGKGSGSSGGGVDMETVWTALNGSTGGKQINTAWLTGVTKTLTIKDGNGTTLGTYNGTTAQTITVSASGNYLPLTGGTMTGNIVSTAEGFIVRMDTDSSNAKTSLVWRNAAGDTLLGGIQFHNTVKRVMLNATGVESMWNDQVGNYTFIVGENELKYNTYNIWHAGNMGSGSGLDADLLDGHDTDYFLSKTEATSTYLTKTDANTTYLSIAFFRSLFRAYNSSNAEVVPNGGNTATIDNIKAMFGFWTEKYISALGKGSSGSSGISIETVWTALANSDSSKQISISHLTNALSGYNPTSNFKTINGESIIGTGNIEIEGGDSASALANKTVTTSTIDGLAGSFTFEGNNLINNQYDWVGLQVGSSVDKAQLLFDNGTIRVRQNDSGGTNASDWTAWTMLPTKVYTNHQITAAGWYRVANLTICGASYIISIRENYYNANPTPATFIINTSYTNATITQIGRASTTPTSITKLRVVKYGNGTYHIDVYANSTSMNTPEVNIFNLGRENTSDGIGLVEWTSASIASGETLIEEADISTGTMIAGDMLLNNAQYIGWKNNAGTAQRICIGLNSDNDFLVGFTTAGSGYNTYLDGNSVQIRYGTSRNTGIYLNSSGNVGIGTTSPSYKLSVNGDVSATNFRGALIGNASSATKLETARTIWGQSFDGTDNVNEMIRVLIATSSTSTNVVAKFLQYTSSPFGLIVSTRGLDGCVLIQSQREANNNETFNISLNANGGNVGIGTTSPSYKLHVEGTLYASGDTTIGGILSMGNNQRIYFKNTSGGGVSALLMDTSNNFVIGEGMSSYNTYLRGSGLTFQTGSSHTERMTIDANGRVYVVNGAQGLRIGDALLTWDSDNNAIKVSAVNGSGQVNFYATGGVSALGVGGSGSSSGGIDADWLKNNDVQIKRLGIGVAPSASYQLNVQGASNFTGAMSVNSMLTVNSSVSAIGGFSTSQGSISAAHDITAGGNGLVYNRLTVGKSSVDTSYIFFVNGSACVSSGLYLASNVYIKHSVPSSGVTLCNITAPSGLTVNGSTSWSSDMRKKDVVSYVNDLDVNKVAKAPVFRFTWKDKRDSVVRVGSSAQYWQNALANSVMDMGEYGLMLDYNAITIASAVVTARKVVDHELHIKQLEERVRELESEIKQLKAA